MSQPDPSPAPTRADGIEVSGFVIVFLARVPGIEEERGLAEIAAVQELAVLRRVLTDAGNPPTEPVIAGPQRAEIRRLEERARERNPRRRRRSLLAAWRVDARRSPLPAVVLAESLSRVPGVELAYAEGAIVDQPTVAVDPPKARAAAFVALDQRYLDAAPVGVGAAAAWARPGGSGAAVGVVDVEEGWRLTHPALSARNSGVLVDPLGGRKLGNRDGQGTYVGDHGTAVLAIVTGADPVAGQTGLAPDLVSVSASSHFDMVTGTPLHVAAAIGMATTALTQPGKEIPGVILLEVQRGSTLRALPTETESLDYDAVALATDNGILVVEAAGNSGIGGIDLDAWQAPHDPRFLLRGDLDHDSGAVIVGACRADLTGAGHRRWGDSNWGKRVDCHAWGEQVGTATATGYQNDFGGTSAASAIVAGVAALVQGMTIAAGGAPLEPGPLRDLLADPANGTAQVNPGLTKRIGPMPNLAALATVVAGPPPAGPGPVAAAPAPACPPGPS